MTTRHLSGLRAKIAAKKAKRAKRKPGKGAPNSDTFSVAMTYVRAPRGARMADHRERMIERKAVYAVCPVGFTPVDKAV